MRKIISFLCACFVSIIALGQENLPAVDKSPLDICYYPVDYPVLKAQDEAKEPPVARVLYSRPKKEGRPVFGGLVEYGKLWRLGANEATEIEFYKPVTISGKKIPKGRYTLYAIVNEATWTMIINKETDVWGSFKYNKSMDLARIDVPVEKTEKDAEFLAMTFEKEKTGCSLIIAWENIRVAMPFTIQ